MRRAMSARAHGVLVLVGPFFSSGQRQAIVDIAAELRPAGDVRNARICIQQGGLVTYSPDAADLYRRAARYVTTILAAHTRGDLPIELPTKFELVINIKTAKRSASKFRRRCLRVPIR